MRVAIVGDYPLNPNRMRGGVEAAFAYLVRELACIQGLDLHVLTLGDPGYLRAVQANLPSVTFHVLPPFRRLEFARNFRSYQAMLNCELKKIQPDLVHAQGATDHAYVALRSRYPTVITVHGVQGEDSRYQPSLHQRARKWVYSQLIERHNLSHTRHLIALSRYVTQYFAHVIHPDTCVYYIPNAIDDSFFKLSSARRSKTVLYAGRLIQRKGAVDLVRAFAGVVNRMPEAQLRFAGEYTSEPQYVAQVQEQVRAANLQAHVHFLGELSENQVLQEFAHCDALVLPSHQETTPMVIAQAMAAGKPVIATPVGGVPEMIEDGKTGIVVPRGDVHQLTGALFQILGDDARRVKMGRAARLYAQENYHAAAVARKTFSAYQRVKHSDD
ncbi:MAG TPA: glycosyltransferase family 4 protein [Anaerolineae bacterium]|nr:glycosyltransferase family 4 protein [Anaerolineae bacterium]